MPAPIPILHLLDSLDLGGAQQVALGIVRYLDRERFAPEIACLHGHGVNAGAFERLGVPVHSLSPARAIPLYLPNLQRLLRARRYRLLHCHLIASTLIGGAVGAMARVPVRVGHEHSDYASRQLPWTRLWLSRRIRRTFAATIAVSPAAAEHLVRHEAVPRERVHVIPNGIDLERFHPRPEARESARRHLDLPPDAPVVAGVGRLSPVKDFATFLRVAAHVRRGVPRARFVIAGEGPEDVALRRLAAELRLGECVRFAGRIDAPERDLYPAADALLMTSRHEGRPLVMLEAMASAVPVVAPAIPGVREVVTDGVNGLLAPPGDVQSLAQRVVTLLGNEPQRTPLTAAALATVQTHHSAQTMTTRVESLYDALLGGGE